MRDRVAGTDDGRIFAGAADCLRSLAQYRTNAAQVLASGPASESLAIKLLELADKLDAASADGLRPNLSPSDRALLMEGLSALAPLVQHAHTVNVDSREISERQQCATTLEAAIELLALPEAENDGG